MEGISFGLSLYAPHSRWIGGVREPSAPTPEKPRPSHFNWLLRQARRAGLSIEDGEDAVQEALLRLHLYKRSRVVSSEEGFLRRTLRNLIVDEFRRSRPDLRRHVSMHDLEDVLVSNMPGPERVVMAEDALAGLERLIAANVPGAGPIVIAHEAGYTVDDISKGAPVAAITIKRRLARAKAFISDLGEASSVRAPLRPARTLPPLSNSCRLQ